MDPAIRDALQYCPNLPSLSSIAMRIVEMGRDPRLNIGALVEVLARDPALATRVLRISNSPLYAQRVGNHSLHQAVIVLGLNATITLALSFSLAETLNVSRTGQERLNRYWRRALISATGSRALGAWLGLRALEELHLAALLQDLGILALATAIPERYSDILAKAPNHDALLAAERAALNADHGEAGSWLMRHWGLSERLALVATAVHDPERSTAAEPAGDATGTNLTQCVRIVAVSGRIADLFLGDDPVVETAAIVEEAARWFVLDHETIRYLLDEIAAALPDVASLFEIDLISQHRASGIIDQAREILATRNLLLLREIDAQRRQVAEMERASRELREVANRDALTGLHNRRHFDNLLHAECTHARANGETLTLALVDLDHFKAVNDTHGHPIGDRVLCQVALTLQANLRDQDAAMRYGGEEFAILLPNTETAQAKILCESLREAIAADTHKTNDGRAFRVTASIGIASFRSQAMPGEAPQNLTPLCQELIYAADQALYAAKRAGRNRVEFVSPVDHQDAASR